jgi:hypothetical protein
MPNSPKLPNELGRSYDDTMLDITGAGVVQIDVKIDGSVLWVNIDGMCVLRVCQIKQGIELCQNVQTLQTKLLRRRKDSLARLRKAKQSPSSTP